ncbi:MAG: primase C-terminal domain-containing protein, partial [Pirellulaceae bacterium]
MIAPFVGTNIPQEILDLVQWINWKYDDNGGKRPVNGTSIGGWRSFDVVAADGPTAFVFAAGDPYVGIDLDDCLDQDGNVLDWAVPIVERLRHVAYGEVSPSGTGIKFITRGKKPDGATCSVNKPDCKVECYEERRFWCMTNQVFQAADTIGDGQDAVNWLCETYLSKTRPKVPSVPKRTKKETVGPSLFRRAQAYADRADLVDSGSRNNAAFNLAGNLHAMEDESGRRLDVDQLFSAMQGWNGRLSDPLDPEELRQVCESAMTNGTPRLPKPPGQASGEVSASP